MINNLAIYSKKKSITFNEFAREIQSFADWINEISSDDDKTYAVCLKNPYEHWLMLLALLKLGKECASVYEPDQIPDDLKGVFSRWIVDDNPTSLLNQSIFNHEEFDKTKSNLSSTVNDNSYKLKIHADAKRLIFTSGTTGRSKLVSLSARQINDHLEDTEYQLNNLINSDTRLLHLMGIDTLGGFLMPLITWNQGGTVLLSSLENQNKSLVNLPLFKSNILCASPVKLKSLLDQIPGVWPGRDQRLVRTAGSRLNVSLRNALIKNMGNTVQLTYGSTELGGISSCDSNALDVDPSTVGKVFNNVSVEIVDADGHKLPNGQVGIVRCKTRAMVNGYKFDEKPDHFKDGWFYPGDIGKLSDEGILYISGRNTDVVNLGGIKVSAVDFETKLLNIPEIEDVCIVSINRSGIEELTVVIVHKDSVNISYVRQKIDELMPSYLNLHVIRVPVLPRNNMGKLLRGQVSNKLSEMINNQLIQ